MSHNLNRENVKLLPLKKRTLRHLQQGQQGINISNNQEVTVAINSPLPQRVHLNISNNNTVNLNINSSRTASTQSQEPQALALAPQVIDLTTDDNGPHPSRGKDIDSLRALQQEKQDIAEAIAGLVHYAPPSHAALPRQHPGMAQDDGDHITFENLHNQIQNDLNGNIIVITNSKPLRRGLGTENFKAFISENINLVRGALLSRFLRLRPNAQFYVQRYNNSEYGFRRIDCNDEDDKLCLLKKITTMKGVLSKGK